MFANFRKMTPRDPNGPLKVLLIGRVSTPRQQVTNIQAGYNYAEQILKEIYDGEMLIKELGEQGSGMRMDRPSMVEAEALIEQGWPDLVLMEDLSKPYRNPRFQYELVQDCFDRRIRLLSLGDNLDTWDQNWEAALLNAASQHGSHIPHTRRRASHCGGLVPQRRDADARTLRLPQGGQGGGRRRHGREKGLRVAKLPEHTPTIRNLRERIVQGFSSLQQQFGTGPSWDFECVAHQLLDDLVDGLNDKKVPVGPYVKRETWNKRLLLELLRDPILCGWRRFRMELYEYIYGTGKHRRDKNPNPEKEFEPELAHMSEEEWKELQQALDLLRSDGGNPTGPQHPRYQIPRSHSISPGQHMRCLRCKDFTHPVGKDQAKCQDALKHESGSCWNHVQVDCERARAALVDVAVTRMERHPQARAAFLDEAWETLQKELDRTGSELEQMDREIDLLSKEAVNLAQAIKKGVTLDSVIEESKTLQKALKKARKQRDEIEHKRDKEGFPATREVLDINPREALRMVARTSFEFSKLMRKIFTEFFIQPVQALDSGLVRPQALLTLDLRRLRGAQQFAGELSEPEQYVVDLFDPPDHIRFMPQIVALKQAKEARGEKTSYDILARESGYGRMTIKRALAYKRLMDAAGLTQPYRVLTEPPAHASRWKPRKRKEITPPRTAA